MLMPLPPESDIISRIFILRGHKVMLAPDLADVYGVETRRLNEQVKRNQDRFPPDFMFQLTDAEWEYLKSHFATSSWGGIRRTTPYAFTEHGAVMLASVLRSERAIAASIQVVRAFVQLRTVLLAHTDLARRLDELEARTDEQFRVVFETLRELLTPPSEPRESIGFKPAPKK